jgi:hypothetical protein
MFFFLTEVVDLVLNSDATFSLKSDLFVEPARGTYQQNNRVAIKAQGTTGRFFDPDFQEEIAMKLVSVDQMRRIEKESDAAGHTYAAMMERAGTAVAQAILSRVAGFQSAVSNLKSIILHWPRQQRRRWPGRSPPPL